MALLNWSEIPEGQGKIHLLLPFLFSGNKWVLRVKIDHETALAFLAPLHGAVWYSIGCFSVANSLELVILS